MKIKSAYRYQASSFVHSTVVFYIVLVILAVFSLVMTIININRVGSYIGEGGYYYASSGSYEGATAIFIFIVGLCSYKDSFFMLSQSGTSRRSQLFSWILAALSLSIVMAVLNEIITVVSGLFVSGYDRVMVVSLFTSVYRIDGVVGALLSIVYGFALNIAAISAGYFITIMFYRLNKPGKIIVGAGVPIFLCIGLPLIEEYITKDAISDALWNFWYFIFDEAYRAIPSLLIAAVIILAFCWLMMRRSVFKSA